MIETKDLKISFGELKVLKGITQTIKQGEKVVIIGPSGSGKSTFLRCLNLLETPDSGSILFEGTFGADWACGQSGRLSFNFKRRSEAENCDCALPCDVAKGHAV